MTNSTPPPNKKKSVTGVILAIIAFGVSYYAVQQFLKPPSIDEMMVKTASEMNERLPMMVDRDTQLDNVVALPGVFQYNYTLVHATKSDMTIDTLKKYLEPLVLNNVKTNPDLKLFRDNRTTLTYYYKDKNGEFIHRFSVSPDQYEEK